jgi:transcriptional regulator with XRE-family HTH domain
VTTFRLNLSEISREAGTTRQHVTSILAGRSIPSIIIAERIDRAMDMAVERRKSFAKAIIEESAGGD